MVAKIKKCKFNDSILDCDKKPHIYINGNLIIFPKCEGRVLVTMMAKRDQTQNPRYPGNYMCTAHDELTEMFKNDVPTLCQKCFKAVASKQVQLVGVLMHRVITQHRRIMTLEKTFDEILPLLSKLEDKTETILKKIESYVAKTRKTNNR